MSGFQRYSDDLSVLSRDRICTGDTKAAASLRVRGQQDAEDEHERLLQRVFNSLGSASVAVSSSSECWWVELLVTSLSLVGPHDAFFSFGLAAANSSLLVRARFHGNATSPARE